MSPRRSLRGAGVALLVFAGLTPVRAVAQVPQEFKNLQVLPKDIARDDLIQVMRGFSFATGLRCEDCHVLGDNNSFMGARFDLDEKDNKRKARFMLRMVQRLNGEILPQLPDRDQPPLTVECKTCHRGLAKPFLLRTELRRIVEQSGVEAAQAAYRKLREKKLDRGAYDFGEWEMNELARELAGSGRDEAAIAMLKLNEEFHADSPSIPFELGKLYERTGHTADAMAAYRRTLERSPEHSGAKERLAALAGG